jgi:hypothetical protein
LATDWRARESGPGSHETRGKTATHRLRRLDQFLMAFDPGLLSRSGSSVVDLGYGRIPVTTVEWYRRLALVYPDVQMIAVERDPDRVAATTTTPGISFRVGDFQLPLKSGEQVRLLRAMNVLRQYEEPAAMAAHVQLIAQLAEGGLIAEGTCDPPGRHLVVALLRRVNGAIHSEGLLFACSFHGGFDPRSFQPVLPKHLIHRVVPGESIYDFFEHWERAAAHCRSSAEFGTRAHFVATGEHLAQVVNGVDARRSWLRNGWLLWRDAPYGSACEG